VVVLHDAGGLGLDTAQQAQWLAAAGFLAVAPDLFHGGNPVRCMISLAREINRRRGASFDDIEAVRRLLVAREDCTGRVGVVGFCMGGGFALLMALDRGFDASSVNYGTVSLSSITDEELSSACPIVASYGRKDRGNRDAAARLSALLERYEIVHDVKEYPSAGHGFMNDHEGAGDRIPPVFRFLSWATGTKFDPEATADARARIVEFLDAQLRQPATPGDA
jgi:carboxymethylenebutenolidase